MKHCLLNIYALAVLMSAEIAESASAESNEASAISLKLVGSSAASSELPVSQTDIPSYYIAETSRSELNINATPTPKAYYKNIYPGIDLICYNDEYQLEYVFTVAPGADPSLIRLLFEGVQSLSISHTGGIRIIIPGGEVSQKAPVVFVESATSSQRSDGAYEMGYGGTVTINTGSSFSKKKSGLNNTWFNLIPAGGQPGGPNYDFYMAKYEVTNDQFLNFLNSAEGNTNTPAGSNMFFDRHGNIWISPRLKRGSDELFEIAGSEISYNAEKPAGSRYSHSRTRDGKTPFLDHPVSGVSWFGAVKYCNWLTIEAGRSRAECCYFEGTNTLDWAPVTATNWTKGIFGDSERQAWLSRKGFRLPMLDSPAGSVTTNTFAEFYKAAAWDTVTNRLFGYGRDSFDGTDANFRDTSGKTTQRTSPAGYFDGKKQLGRRQTRPNENHYGIFDLSGNVAEWMNDFGSNNLPEHRAVCGGSWENAPTPLTCAKIMPASSTSTFGGFRPTTTYLPLESLRIHILYNFFMEQPPAERQAEQEQPAREEELVEKEKPPKPPKIPAMTTPSGIIYKPKTIESPPASPAEN